MNIMIDRVVYMMNGWLVGGEQAKQMRNELYEINEDYPNDLDGFFIDTDLKDGYAIFFGPIFDRCDVKYEDSGYSIIDEKVLYEADEKYKKFLKKYPKYAEVFNKYANNIRRQVMVVLHVW